MTNQGATLKADVGDSYTARVNVCIVSPSAALNKQKQLIDFVAPFGVVDHHTKLFEHLDLEESMKQVNIAEFSNALVRSDSGASCSVRLSACFSYGEGKSNCSNDVECIVQYQRQKILEWITDTGASADRSDQERLDLDERIHCMVYAVCPPRLSEMDLTFLLKMHKLVPIVLVVTHGETMTAADHNRCLDNIRNQLKSLAMCAGIESISSSILFDFQESGDRMEDLDDASAASCAGVGGMGISVRGRADSRCVVITPYAADEETTVCSSSSGGRKRSSSISAMMMSSSTAVVDDSSEETGSVDCSMHDSPDSAGGSTTMSGYKIMRRVSREPSAVTCSTDPIEESRLTLQAEREPPLGPLNASKLQVSTSADGAVLRKRIKNVFVLATNPGSPGSFDDERLRFNLFQNRKLMSFREATQSLSVQYWRSVLAQKETAAAMVIKNPESFLEMLEHDPSKKDVILASVAFIVCLFLLYFLQ